MGSRSERRQLLLPSPPLFLSLFCFFFHPLRFAERGAREQEEENKRTRDGGGTRRALSFSRPLVARSLAHSLAPLSTEYYCGSLQLKTTLSLSQLLFFLFLFCECCMCLARKRVNKKPSGRGWSILVSLSLSLFSPPSFFIFFRFFRRATSNKNNQTHRCSTKTKSAARRRLRAPAPPSPTRAAPGSAPSLATRGSARRRR